MIEEILKAVKCADLDIKLIFGATTASCADSVAAAVVASAADVVSVLLLQLYPLRSAHYMLFLRIPATIKIAINKIANIFFIFYLLFGLNCYGTGFKK